jgi:hypothetical protein
MSVALLASVQVFAGGFQGNGEYTPIEQLYGKKVIELQQYFTADPAGIAAAKKLGITNPKALRDHLLADQLFPLDEDQFENLGADAEADRALVAEDALLKLKASPALAKAAAESAKAIPEARLQMSTEDVQLRFPIRPEPFQLTLGEAALNGAGCAQGLGVTTRIDSRRGLIDLSFNSLYVDSFEKKLARTNCSLALPISIPEGQMLVIESLDTSAIIDNPKGAKVTTNFEAFFAGSTGKRITRQFTKAMSKRDVVRTKLNTAAKCGQDVNLRLNISALLQSPTGAIGMVAIDRAILKVSLKPCQ